MKKTYIALAVLALAALAGCQTEEFRDDVYVPKEGEILFRISNSEKATKASESDNTVKGVMIDLGNNDGTNFFLEETITRLDGIAARPETKGTPGYTENFHYMYGGFDATVYTKTGTNAYSVYDTDGRFTLVDEAKLIYKKKYDNDIWDKTKSGNGMYFFLKAYEGSSMAGVSNLNYHLTHEDAVTTGDNQHLEYNVGSISFHYNGASLTTAEDQKDILFTSREITSEADYNKFVSQTQGVPVLFHHVLTGVKFAIANYDADKKITIKEVIFNGLYDSGDCVVTPTASGWREGETDTDNITDYSSAETSLWSNRESSGTSYSSDTFGAPVNYDTGNFGNDNNKYPSSFSAAGATNNLNKADASQTFWFIPQAMNENITLTIKYTFGSDVEQTWTINFGEILAGQNVEWHAGELHTYTIKIDEVNVRIEDTVTSGTPNPDNHDPKGLIGSKKSAVKITNTGNTDVFIRAAIVGQWVLDKGGERLIMFGFTDEVNNLYAVESWYEDQFKNHTGEHGVFDGLAGYKNTSTDTPKNYSDDYNGWVYKDGYYYCKTSVAPGADTPTPLFQSYEIKKIPHARNSGVVLSENMYFTLEISTQAINARTSNGTLRTDWEDAWAEALAIDETPGEDDGE